MPRVSRGLGRTEGRLPLPAVTMRRDITESFLARARPRVAQAAREQQELAALAGQMIDGAIAHDAQPALQAAEEAVAALERVAVLGGEQARARADLQRAPGARRAELWLFGAVHEL